MKQPKIPMNLPFTDPTADATLILLRVPKGNGKYTIEDVAAVFDTALDASGTNGRAVTLIDAGLDGLGTTPITTTVGGATTDVANDWAAGVPKELPIVAGKQVIGAGRYIGVKYDETGTDAFKNGAVTLTLTAAARNLVAS